MSPAMDRVSKLPANRAMLGLAIVIVVALGPVELGCARLQSLGRQKPLPPPLGRLRESGDFYSSGHAPAASHLDTSPVPAMTEAPSVVVGDDPEPPITQTVVEPAPVDNVQPTSGTRASIGVPDGARLIASAERGADPAKVVKQAREALDRMASYQVALHRQERVDGKLLPEEDVILAVRREPRAIRLTWPDGPNKGREVLYRADEPGGPMHVNPGGILPRMTLSPTSALVMRNSRHPITEAGFESLVVALEAEVARPNSGGLTLIGIDRPVLARTTAEGENWRITIDPSTHLPELVECDSGTGELLERYSFRDLKADLPELLTAEAFDPIARWGQPRGLFGRLSGDAPPPR